MINPNQKEPFTYNPSIHHPFPSCSCKFPARESRLENRFRFHNTLVPNSRFSHKLSLGFVFPFKLPVYFDSPPVASLNREKKRKGRATKQLTTLKLGNKSRPRRRKAGRETPRNPFRSKSTVARGSCLGRPLGYIFLPCLAERWTQRNQRNLVEYLQRTEQR